MSEFKELQQKNANDLTVNGGRCKLCSSVLKLEKSKIKDFYEALIDRTITHATIVEVLGNWDIKTSMSTMSYHRTGGYGHAQHIETLRKAAES
jgi:hypothetical protein